MKKANYYQFGRLLYHVPLIFRGIVRQQTPFGVSKIPKGVEHPEFNLDKSLSDGRADIIHRGNNNGDRYHLHTGSSIV
jgi:hypothetical protein